MALPEPWLRGTIEALHPSAAHLLYTFEQTGEELAHFCSGLADDDIWKTPHPDVPSLGFQLRHIAGSVDRLTTYLRGEQLNQIQLAALRNEHEPGASFRELMGSIEDEFQKTEAAVRTLSPESYP